MDKLLFIFLISAIARMSISLIMIPLIKEIRKTKKFDSEKALKELIPRRIRLPSFEGHHELIMRKTHHHRKSQ